MNVQDRSISLQVGDKVGKARINRERGNNLRNGDVRNPIMPILIEPV
jgi:hypothetical protein